MVEKITSFLVDEKDSHEQNCTLRSGTIRKILEKSILKAIMVGDGFFDEFYDANHPNYTREKSLIFLELLVEKLEQLIDKENSKNKPFKMHQEGKKKFLFGFITEHFRVSPLEVMDVQSRPATEP